MNGTVEHVFIGFIKGLLLIAALSLVPARVYAKDPVRKKPPAQAFLEQKRIHADYSEGDFEGVIAAIDSFTRVNKTYSHDDSIFIAKHLAVIYSANPVTREKGKNYMFRLLELVPTAKIVDMFVSEEIDRIFEKVREEYVVRRQSLGQETPTHLESNQYATDKLTMNNTDAKTDDKPIAKNEKKSSHAVYWVAGGAGLVMIAGTAYYFLQPKKTTDKSFDVPE